ncbi:MAG: DUF1127 domain-containing protein [Rhodospirillales bacterium]|nr:DUF1127 domain-containing protein [Rhodospirillales bacterium]
MSNSRYEAIRSPAALFPRERIEVSGSIGRAVRRVFELLYTWQDRAQQRAHLAALDDRLLGDMGIDRASAKREAAKPFWRP